MGENGQKERKKRSYRKKSVFLPYPISSDDKLFDIGSFIKKVRERMFLSQETISKATGLPRLTILRIENGETPNPSFYFVQRILAVMGIRITLSVAICSELHDGKFEGLLAAGALEAEKEVKVQGMSEKRREKFHKDVERMNEPSGDDGDEIEEEDLSFDFDDLDLGDTWQQEDR